MDNYTTEDSLKKLKQYFEDRESWRQGVLDITPYIYKNSPEDITIVLDFNIKNRDVEVTLNSDGTWFFDDNAH